MLCRALLFTIQVTFIPSDVSVSCPRGPTFSLLRQRKSSKKKGDFFLLR